MKHIALAVVWVIGAGYAMGCGGDETPATSTGEPSGSSGPSGSGGSGQGGNGGAGQGGNGGSSSLFGTCKDDPPAGATTAPPPPAYTGGTCPALMDGFNDIISMGNMRRFRLVLPANLDPMERAPVIFLWHWLGGSADDFYTRGEVQAAVDSQRFIAVIPEAKGDVNVFGLELQWPYDITQSDARMNEEFVFFDDMLSCVSEQFQVNNNCVASAGVSAGALFTDQLAGGRSQYLSSILSLSGGTGGNLIKPFGNPTHKMPAIVLWGGQSDNCFSLMDFNQTSQNLEDSLTAGGHFFLECIHNCGHAQPPLDVAPGQSAFAPLWQFVLDHPYWLKAGESPYTQNGIPAELPTWCGIGKSSAEPRTGACPNPPGC